MDITSRLREIADQLKQGKTVNSVTVREFLSWFDAQRRGYWIVTNIREALTTANILTEPDWSTTIISDHGRQLKVTGSSGVVFHRFMVVPTFGILGQSPSVERSLWRRQAPQT